MCDKETADLLRESRLKAWQMKHQVQLSRRWGAVHRILPNTKETKALLVSLGLPAKSSGQSPQPPWADHDALWMRDGVDVAYTTQPYNFTDEKRAEVTAWCDRLGLSVAFSDDESWRLPGETTLVTIWNPENPL